MSCRLNGVYLPCLAGVSRPVSVGSELDDVAVGASKVARYVTRVAGGSFGCTRLVSPLHPAPSSYPPLLRMLRFY